MNIQLNTLFTTPSNTEGTTEQLNSTTINFSTILEEEFSKGDIVSTEGTTEQLNSTTINFPTILEEEFNNNEFFNIDTQDVDDELTETNKTDNNIDSHQLYENNSLISAGDRTFVESDIDNETFDIESSNTHNALTIEDVYNANSNIKIAKKNTKSGNDFIDDVKYIQDSSKSLSTESTTTSCVQDSKSSELINTEINSKSTLSTSNDTHFNNDEAIEGELLYNDLSSTKDTSLEEEVFKMTNGDEISTSDIMKQLKDGISTSSTPKHIQIILKPRNLGTLNLNIKFINNAMYVDIHVDNSEIQNLLSNNLLQLEQILNPDSCLNIETINIIKKQDDIKYSKDILEKTLSLNKMIKNNKTPNKPLFLFR